MDKQVLSIKEFCAAYGIGRSTAYKEIESARLRTFKVRRRRLIRRVDVDNWLADRLASSEQDTEVLSPDETPGPSAPAGVGQPPVPAEPNQ